MLMKKTKICAVIGSIFLSLNLAYATDLVVWEDLGKSHGIEKAVAQFEKENNCKVILKDSDYVGHLAAYESALKDGSQIPDILMLPADRMGYAAKSGLITPLSFMQKEEHKYLNSSIKAFTYKGEIYAVPRSMETMVVYYNQDLMKYPFEQFDDYYKLSMDLKKQGKYGIIGKWDFFYFAYGFLKGYDSYLFGNNSDGSLNPKDLGVASDNAVKATEYLAKVCKDILPPSVLGNDGFGEIEKLFTTGKAAAVITGPWELETFAKSGINYGVAPLPRLPNGKFMTPFLGFRGYAITQKSNNKALAEKFLKFINQPQYALQRYQSILELPPIHEILTNPLINNDDFANAIAVQALNAEATPSIPEMATVWDPMNTAISDIVTGKASAQNALNKAKKQILAAIDGKSADVEDKAEAKEDEETQTPAIDENIATEDKAASDNEDSLAHSSEALESDNNDGVSVDDPVSHDDENIDEAFSVEVENAPDDATSTTSDSKASSDNEEAKPEDNTSATEGNKAIENTTEPKEEKTEEKKEISLDSLDFG